MHPKHTDIKIGSQRLDFCDIKQCQKLFKFKDVLQGYNH